MRKRNAKDAPHQPQALKQMNKRLILQTIRRRQPVSRSEIADETAISEALIKARLLTRFQADELLAGRYRKLRIDRYVLKGIVGVGGMGTVFRAVDTQSGQDVALKVALNSILSLKVSHTLRYSAEPPEGFEKTDRILAVSIVAKMTRP